jgi:hypothetical protein
MNEAYTDKLIDEWLWRLDTLPATRSMAELEQLVDAAKKQRLERLAAREALGEAETLPAGPRSDRPWFGCGA